MPGNRGVHQPHYAAVGDTVNTIAATVLNQCVNYIHIIARRAGKRVVDSVQMPTQDALHNAIITTGAQVHAGAIGLTCQREPS